MIKLSTLFGVFVLITALPSTNAIAAGTPANSPVQEIRLTKPLGFIENKGQFLDQNEKPRTDLLYLLKRPGMKVQLMKNRLSYELYSMEGINRVDEAYGAPNYRDLDPEDWPYPDFNYTSTRIDVEFLGANPNPEVVADQMMPDYLNYYLSYTPVEGITRVRLYNQITYKNLYPNIDLVLIATPEQNPDRAVAYDFVVHPGGNVNDIQYRYNGNDKQVLYKNGMLETQTSLGTIQEFIPESYLQNENQEKLNPVDVSFYFNKDVISFRAAKYDHNHSLVIDPYLVWATYCGGDTSEEGRGLATDSSGHVIIIGATASKNNIATAGAFDTSLLGLGDIFLEKYDSMGKRVWGTYYGGSSRDQVRGIVADHLGNYYLGCHTDSPDGMSTPGAWRTTFSGGVGDDAVLAYFSSDGFRIWATYYGGADEEIIRRVAIDKDHNVFMVGYTFSDTGIATPGVSQTVWGGDADLCLSKWTPDGQLIWGTYLGGHNEEHGRSCSVDKYGNCYVNGSVASDGLGTDGVSRPNHADKQDFLLAKITGDGQLAWFSYWGGKNEDRGRGVFVNPSSTYVYFTGYSASDTGVATPGAYQDYWNVGNDNNGLWHDMVAMKWTLDGQIVWGTYLGGTRDDRGRSITMIGDDKLYISGSTESNDTMATPDALQPFNGGNGHGDMFLQLFDTTGWRIYGTFYGGAGDDDNLALAVDPTKTCIYLIGTSRSDNITTPDVEQPLRGGLDDALLVKIRVSDLSVGVPTVAGDPTELSLYPNPATGTFYLTFPNARRQLVSVHLKNVLGEDVMAIYEGITGPQFGQQVNVSNLPQGIYYVTVKIGVKLITKKLIITR